MENRLTTKQARVFNILNELARENNRYPSFAEIAKVYGCTRQSINDHLKFMVKKGYLINEGGKYVPTQQSREMFMQSYNNPAKIKLMKGE